jgi:hypothetical protein
MGLLRILPTKYLETGLHSGANELRRARLEAFLEYECDGYAHPTCGEPPFACAFRSPPDKGINDTREHLGDNRPKRPRREALFNAARHRESYFPRAKVWCADSTAAHINSACVAKLAGKEAQRADHLSLGWIYRAELRE